TIFTTETLDKIPNYFTPNNDGVHDTWIVPNKYHTIVDILIFNRFGKIIKRLNPNNMNGWNGNYNNNPIDSTDYWYIITYKSGKVLRGNFSLIR
ncbi:MAG TPA: T9SS type B sorting domain-containing protein, partial [Crocinitomix sp.]|nr:T9SS type B sorting domain-containing protein [Crocinitomix sp.]